MSFHLFFYLNNVTLLFSFIVTIPNTVKVQRMYTCVKDRCSVKLKFEIGLPTASLEDFDRFFGCKMWNYQTYDKSIFNRAR